MHLSLTDCAHCEKTLGLSSYDPYSTYIHRPKFCNSHCYNAATKPYVAKHYVRPTGTYSGPLEREYEALFRAEKHVAANMVFEEAQAAWDKERRENSDLAYRLASTEFFDVWHDRYQKKKDQEDAKEQAANDKEWAKLLKEQQAAQAAVDAIAAQQEREAALIAPREIPDEVRFEHSMCLGPSRSGKTTLLQALFLQDMALPDPPAYVIIDPKGLLIERIAKLDVFNPVNGRLRDRLVIVDPTSDNPPALGMFDIPKGAPFSYQAELIEAFAYIFSMAGAALTQRQSIPFAYVVRLVFFMRGNLDTLMDVLDDSYKERRFATEVEAFSETDPVAARFFRKDFYSSDFEGTKQQIKTRINEIMSRPSLYKMLAASRNHLSFYECLRQKKIVIVNTAMGQLKPSGSSLFGRYIISQTLAAAFTRKERTPVYLVIDEFQDFCDESQTPRMLRLAGEYKLGISVYFQMLHSFEMTEDMQTAVTTNTSIKYASNPDGKDLTSLSVSMRCDKDFLLRQQKTPTHARFACYVRNIGLEHPFVVEVPLGNIQQEPQMSEEHYRYMLALNDARLSGSELPPEPSVAEAQPEQVGAESPKQAHYFWGPPAPQGFWASVFKSPNTAPGLYYQPPTGEAFLIQQPYPDYILPHIPPLPGTELQVHVEAAPIPDNSPEREVAPLPQKPVSPPKKVDKDEGGWA